MITRVILLRLCVDDEDHGHEMERKRFDTVDLSLSALVLAY
jgi:hypothetical protein